MRAISAVRTWQQRALTASRFSQKTHRNSLLVHRMNKLVSLPSRGSTRPRRRHAPTASDNHTHSELKQSRRSSRVYFISDIRCELYAYDIRALSIPVILSPASREILYVYAKSRETNLKHRAKL